MNPASHAASHYPSGRLQTYARIAGVLFLLSMVAGFFGEAYVPSKIIVLSDAAATAHNIRSAETLYRSGFAAYLVEALCDVTLSLLFYALLKTVDENWALLAALFGLLATSLFAVAELFYFGAGIVLRSADSLRASPRTSWRDSRSCRSSSTSTAAGSSWCSTGSPRCCAVT